MSVFYNTKPIANELCAYHDGLLVVANITALKNLELSHDFHFIEVVVAIHTDWKFG